MSKSGNKKIDTFINRVLPKYVGKDEVGIWKLFNYTYCFKGYYTGNWIPKEEYLDKGYFTNTSYRNPKTKQTGIMYYITPLGQEEIVKELSSMYPIGFGYGMAQNISHILKS